MKQLLKPTISHIIGATGVTTICILLLCGAILLALTTCSDDSGSGTLPAFVCENGMAADGATSANSGDTRCISCNKNYQLNDTTNACDAITLAFDRQPEKDGDSTANTASITLTVNKDATIYWIVYADGVDVPDTTTLMANITDPNIGIADSGDSGIVATARTPLLIQISGLAAATNYDFYAVATGHDRAESVVSQKYDLHTTVEGVVAFRAQSTIENTSRSGTTITLTADEDATLYWVVYEDEQIDLTAADLISAAMGSGTTNGEVKRGAGTDGEGIKVTADTPHPITVTGLTQLTEYFFYAAVQDSDNNKTRSAEFAFATIGYPYVCAGGTAADGTDATTNDVNRCSACDNGLSPNSVFVCEEVLAFTSQPALDATVSVTANTASITLTVNKDATIHWVVYADGADALDATALISNTADSTTVGIARSESDGVAARAGKTLSIPIFGLAATTNYDLYAVATAVDPDETVLSRKYDLLTTQTGVPSFSDQPTASATSRTGTTITLIADEAATLYWVVYEGEQTDLTAADLIRAAMGSGTTNGEVKRGADIDIDADTPYPITVTGLTQLTDYYFYAAVQDSDNNTTRSAGRAFATIGYPYVCAGGTAADGTGAATNDVNRCSACDNELSPNSLFECEELLAFTSQPNKDGDITANTASITLTVNKDATIHWVVYADGADPPDVTALIADAADGVTVGIARSGSDGVVAQAGKALSIPISGLAATTSYDFYAVATAVDPDETVLSREYDLLTTQTGVPSFSVQPTASATSRSGTTITLTADEAATLYWVVYEGEQTDLTAADLISAATGSDTSNGEVKRGAGTDGEGINVTADTPHPITITGLTQLTEYFFYAAVQDSDNNTTRSAERAFTTIGYPYVCAGGTADSTSGGTTNDVNRCSACDNELSPNSLFECEELLAFTSQPALDASVSVTANTASITVTVNKDATIHWVVYADGFDEPDTTTVIANAADSTVGRARSGRTGVSADARTSLTIPIGGLAATTDYDVYVAATATDPTERVVSHVLNLRTNNQGVPSFSTQPTAGDTSQTGTTITLATGEDVRLYWVVYDKPQNNLTAQAMINAAMGSGTTNGEVRRGAGTNGEGIVVAAGDTQSVVVSRLAPLTQYYFYAAIVDSDTNQTLSSEVPFRTIGYLYACVHGTPISGRTALANQNHCVRCDEYYRLEDDHSCVATVYACDNGNPITTGTPQSNREDITDANVNKCNDCRTGYYKSSNACKEGGVVAQLAVTALSDTSIAANIDVDAPDDIDPASLYWVLYAGGQHTKAIAQVVADATSDNGVARNVSENTITQDAVIPMHINALNASTTYTLYVVADNVVNSLVFDTHGPNSNYGVDFDVYCNIQSKYIPTDFSDNITGTNGATPTEAWTPSFNELGQLPNGHRAQRACYKYAYYYRQSLPDIPPPTTTAHTNSLPSGMFYDRSKYKLVFEEDFGPNTATNPHNTDKKFKIGTDEEQQVNLHKIFEGLQNNRDEEFAIASLSGHGGRPKILWPGLDKNGNEPSWLTEDYNEEQRKEIRAALQNEWAWPAFIKDGRFHVGMGRVSLNHVGNNDTFYCNTKTVAGEQVHTRRFHDFNSDPFSLNGEVDTCECDEDTADGCAYFFGSWTADNIKYQYGFLEIDIAELMASARRGSSTTDRSIYNFMELLSATNHTRYNRTGTWPQMFNTHTDEGYFELWPVELQLMEHYISGAYNGQSGWWLVKHFYPPSKHPTNRNARHSRFYDTYTINETRTHPNQKRARKLGVEWTPAGYRIWEGDYGGPWVDLSTTAAWSLSGACEEDDKVNDFWQCGISHVVASVKHSGIAGTGELMRAQNPRYVFNHIRIYQPEGNYAEVERIYK